MWGALFTLLHAEGDMHISLHMFLCSESMGRCVKTGSQQKSANKPNSGRKLIDVSLREIFSFGQKIGLVGWKLANFTFCFEPWPIPSHALRNIAVGLTSCMERVDFATDGFGLCMHIEGTNLWLPMCSYHNPSLIHRAGGTKKGNGTALAKDHGLNPEGISVNIYKGLQDSFVSMHWPGR